MTDESPPTERQTNGPPRQALDERYVVDESGAAGLARDVAFGVRLRMIILLSLACWAAILLASAAIPRGL